MEPQPEPEAIEARQINLRDVAQHEPGILANIGSRIPMNDRVRLGEALGRHFKDYRLGAKHLVATTQLPQVCLSRRKAASGSQHSEERVPSR